MFYFRLRCFFQQLITQERVLQSERSATAEGRDKTMATAASVTNDLTTCPICVELVDNPKSLPCLHAFCLKCLQSCFKDRRPGSEVPCPTCRKKFQIPVDGLGGLQHHFIIQRLVDVQKADKSTISTTVQPGRSYAIAGFAVPATFVQLVVF